MALDGIFLSAIKDDLQGWIGSRIDRIHQPSRDELIISLRRVGGNIKLLICANSSNARIHFTKMAPKNPKTPPMFCMLLRKHLSNGKLNSVDQVGLDRVINLEFETKNDIGDTVIYVMSVEIMGRHSNIILYNKKTKIILDAIKRIDDNLSKVRPVFPGEKYIFPPTQAKMDILQTDAAEIVSKVCEKPNIFAYKALLDTIEGISPIVARELALVTDDKAVSEFNIDDKTVLFDKIRWLKNIVQNKSYDFTVLIDHNNPKDFSFIDIEQYGSVYNKHKFKDGSELLDYFYVEKDAVLRAKQYSLNLVKYLQNTISRAKRTLDIRIKKLDSVKDRDYYRQYGDLLSANLSILKKGQKEIKLENFYDDNNMVTLKLDPEKTPVQNVQKYYKDYKKAANAQKKLKELIFNAKTELYFLESELDLVLRTYNEEELKEIVNELREQNYYVKRADRTKVKTKSNKIVPLTFKSSDGFIIWCGKNNKQNDLLTMKKARKDDIWLHTQKIHGSHVIIVTDGKEVPITTLEEAAIIAAYHSKGKNGAQIPVDYTKVKNVRKPNGAKPGMVIFDDYKTLFVNPDLYVIEKLRYEN